jgi:hypothetical protein
VCAAQNNTCAQCFDATGPDVVNDVPRRDGLWHTSKQEGGDGAFRTIRDGDVSISRQGFLDQVLWPEFSELDHALQAYLHQVTLCVIREEVYADASEAASVREP